MKLAGKTALVTGASSGIGRAIALRFAREGADIAINGRDEKKIAAVVREVQAIGRRAVGVPANVASHAEARAMVDKAAAALGRIDILVLSAGVFHFTPFLEITETEWDEVLTIDLKGMFNCAQAALPAMVQRKWGRIILITAVSGTIGVPGMGHICAAKAGAQGMARCLALEFAPAGVTVNVIGPGPIDTPMLAEFTEEMHARIPGARGPAVGRIGKPDEIAEAALYFASSDSGFTTGQVMNVAGGLGI